MSGKGTAAKSAAKSAARSMGSSEASSGIPPLPPTERSALQMRLNTFTIRHQAHHRPMVLVTSGGTATDLEVNAVRYLDNFSTGLRGAVSVEQFMRRGYAVIHLWRKGSAAPYARILSEAVGLAQANHGLGFDAIGRLFECPLFDLDGDEAEEEERMVREAVRGSVGEGASSSDPWLYSYSKDTATNYDEGLKGCKNGQKGSNFDPGEETIGLNRRIINSSRVQRMLRERNHVVREGLLLTVPFRTVEEYLAKLKLCTESLRDSQSLAMVYLAAAVSDFYIPRSKKSLHKIQSQDYGTGGPKAIDDENCLTLKLHPVPKLITDLRGTWAPDAFVVSFKLETDKTILRHKAMSAVNNYGVHVVIGNVLSTRHEKVWVLHRKAGPEVETDEPGSTTTSTEVGDPIPRGFEMTEISRSGLSNGGPAKRMSGPLGVGNTGGIDELEDATISYIIEQHFGYIAHHYPNGNGDRPRSALAASAEAAERHQRHLAERKLRVQNELYWRRMRDVALNVVGSALGVALSYGISTMLQRRMIKS